MDFRDTAALRANCDLLLSADSGVVHLAGAMSVPTWVVLGPQWLPHTLVQQRASVSPTAAWQLAQRGATDVPGPAQHSIMRQ
jgi:ADP-heptose:LPS heptosyltransferase